MKPNPNPSDEDGNLTADARWSYAWDGENRLVAMESAAAAVTAGVAKQKLEFAYDAQGRRISKKVSNWSGGSWVLASQTLFLYDGWNMVAELNALSSNAAVRTYGWGLDLSGSLQGAGGVGGLVVASDGTTTAFPAYDGNGNVAAYVATGTGATVASYDYTTCGETLVAEGPAQAAFPFRFSTKYVESETGLLYYGLRYYQPATGRWLSRDPIEENGGVNLYGFVGNGPLLCIDALGLETLKLHVSFAPSANTRDARAAVFNAMKFLNQKLKECQKFGIDLDLQFYLDRKPESEDTSAFPNVNYIVIGPVNQDTPTWGETTTGSRIRPDAPEGVIAHELGHQGGYTVPAAQSGFKKRPDGSWGNDLSHNMESASLMYFAAPNGGQVDCIWCNAIKKLTK